MCKKIYITLLFFLLIIKIQADLPVHCLKHQIIGEWTLYMTDPYLKGDGQVPCGHKVPDKADTSYLAMEDSFPVGKEFKLVLDAQDMVQAKSGESGFWTMIYDEGFQINFQDTEYFAFNKYFLQDDETSYGSECSETLVGWYSNKATGDRGCYKAIKADQKKEVTQNVKQDKVVQPLQPQKINIEAVKEEEAVTQKEDTVNTNDRDDFDDASEISSFVEKSQEDQQKYNDIDDEEFVHVHKQSKDHQKIVNRLNLVQKSWSAKVPDSFKDMTLGQMNKRAGRKKYHSFLQVGTKAQNNKDEIDYKHYDKEPLKDLPKEFTWADKLEEVVAQKDCGSCYTIATMEMIQTRIRIKYSENVKLSAQESLDCNYYNQGCDGGYGFLVSKYYTENPLVSEECYPYQSADGICDTNKCANSLASQYKVGSYEYIGGQYGKSSEKKMMEEIHKNGPIVVSFEPGMDFMYYNTGVYHKVDAQEWIKNNENLPEWEKVDHSVLCYGWGETVEGEKYWIIQNSWGSDWGESGSFRIRRGTDESHIESMGEAAHPIKVKKTSQSLVEIEDLEQTNKNDSSNNSRGFLKKNQF